MRCLQILQNENKMNYRKGIITAKKFAAATAILTISAMNVYAQSSVPYKGVIGKTSSDSKEWYPENPKAPAGAPNVVWIMLDDVGYGASSAFGGLISTPTFDSLANNGLRYTNFHTAGICAPTRAALLTGRNHHSVHMGGFAHTVLSAGYPGYDGRIPASKGTIAEILRENGYNTFAVGKYGVTPDEDSSDAGPFDRWPLGKGFDHFFGFLGSQTDQYKPALIEDNAHIKPDGRHFSEQLTDKAIEYISKQKKSAPDKPFFLYYTPAAVHAPHQVAKEWSDKYKGKFDEGWDVYREKVFANEKKLGVIPANAVLPARNPNIKAWNTLPAKEKKLYARFMEVYAGYLTYTDYEVSRVTNYLKEINQLDNTLVFVIIGDNGASKEGTYHGVAFPKKIPAATTEESAYISQNLQLNPDDIGTPESSPNYPLGWAQATNTPFRYWKQDANSEGGTHNPLIVFYPKGIKDKGGIRNQYGHVIDLLPTTLEFIGAKLPEKINGIEQDSIQGTSLAYSFTDAKAPSKHTNQYYYIFGSRAIYKDGWKAGAAHYPDNIAINDFTLGKIPADQPFENDKWELYNLTEDFNENNDLAKKYPEKLAELKTLFDTQAKQYNIYPFIDWSDVYKKRKALLQAAPPATPAATSTK